jgi:hypothetical protein
LPHSRCLPFGRGYCAGGPGETCSRRSRYRSVRRSLALRRIGHLCRPAWGPYLEDQGSDPACLGSDAGPVHPGWGAIQLQRGRGFALVGPKMCTVPTILLPNIGQLRLPSLRLVAFSGRLSILRAKRVAPQRGLPASP